MEISASTGIGEFKRGRQTKPPNIPWLVSKNSLPVPEMVVRRRLRRYMREEEGRERGERKERGRREREKDKSRERRVRSLNGPGTTKMRLLEKRREGNEKG